MLRQNANAARTCVQDASLSAYARGRPTDGKEVVRSNANPPIIATRLQETDGCSMRTAVQEQRVQMFAGQNNGMLHGAVADVNPGKPSVYNIPNPVAAQRDSPVQLVTTSFVYGTSALHGLRQQVG
jgi:hypothetical protein